MPIVQLIHTNNPDFVVRFSVDVCILGIRDPASILLLCLFQTV
jgi:hypothetical protein